MKDIRTTALKLAEKYEERYKEWCKENPGKIMNGNIIKVDPLKKASYCKTIDEIRAMRTYYDIALRSAEGPNGFLFSRDVMDELLEILNLKYN